MRSWKDAELGAGEEYELRGDALRLYDINVDKNIVSWRVECFEALGFHWSDAMRLALRRDVDREVVEKAVKAGNAHEHVMEALL